MARTEPASAIVIRVPVPTAIERLRRRWAGSAVGGVPAHVTVLFPFLPARDLSPDHRAAIAVAVRGIEPFELRYRRVERFPQVVYLAPEPAAPIIAMTSALAGPFPDLRPYGGAFTELVPHLTIAETAAAPLDEIEAATERELPFGHRVTEVEVLVESAVGRWRRHWRIPLGAGSALRQ